MGLWSTIQFIGLWSKVVSFHMDMAGIVRVEQFLTELARVVAWVVLVFNVVDNVMLLSTCLGAFQTLK
jgi:hypothetical protein